MVIRGTIHVLTVHTYRYILDLHEYRKSHSTRTLRRITRYSPDGLLFSPATSVAPSPLMLRPTGVAGTPISGWTMSTWLCTAGTQCVWIVTFRGLHLHLSMETLKIITDLAFSRTEENTVLCSHLQLIILYPIHSYSHWPRVARV